MAARRLVEAGATKAEARRLAKASRAGVRLREALNAITAASALASPPPEAAWSPAAAAAAALSPAAREH